jgi:lipopolysaccharide transport system ATP-binding protein
VWNLSPQAVLNLSIHLSTIEGTHVFATVSAPRSRAVGLYREAVLIPGDLLNDGVYNVTVQVVQDTSETLYLHPNILTFEVHDVPRTGSWFGKWPGVVRPVLAWESDPVAPPELAN